MKTKNLMVSLAIFVFALAIVATVSASEITNDYMIEVDNIVAFANGVQTNDISVVAGQDVRIEVYFNSLVDDTDVTIEAEIEGEKVKFDAITSPFDIENGFTYRKTLVLQVPYELKDLLSDALTLNIEIDGKEHKSELQEIKLLVQRPSYNAVIKSIMTPNSINAGETFPVEFVLKNMGYNDLEDVYVEVAIPELGISQGPMWIGDLVNLECDVTSPTTCDDEDDEDTLAGRFYLEVPFSVDSGVYDLEFTVYNEDTESTAVKQILVKNDFASEVIATNTQMSASVGEETEFSLLLVNPTDNVRVYTLIIESSNGVSTSTEQTVVAVPAGSSKTVSILAEALKEGSHEITVTVLSGDSLVDTVTYNLDADGRAVNSTLILSIILAIIFIVLLVVLIVLLARKPEKAEEFSESYY